MLKMELWRSQNQAWKYFRYITFFLFFFICAHTQEWVPIFSSSGGSAHLVAAKFLDEELKERGIETTVVNVTSSRCTVLPQVGTFCTNLWNRAQEDGNVKMQIFFLRFQSLFDNLFFFPAYLTFKRTLLKKEHLPSRVICTSPLFLSALCKAALHVNKHLKTNTSKIDYVDLYMVETPCDEATYYLKPLKSLNQEKRSLIRLFTLPPTEREITMYGGEEEFWLTKTGLSKKRGQVIYDPPCRTSFKHAENLPKPGESTQLTLKANCDEEAQFLSSVSHNTAENQYLFNIKSSDRVGLIMMGSFPCEEALFAYIDAATDLCQRVKKRSFLFISCGHVASPTYKKVLAKLQSKGKLHIIPFTNQPVENIFARADFSLTRSGGMTTQEILALKTNPKRFDPKTILIHSQISKPFLQQLASKASYEEQLIQEGIPLWEGGNARYLKERIKEVQIVCPSAAHFALAEQLF